MMVDEGDLEDGKLIAGNPDERACEGVEDGKLTPKLYRDLACLVDWKRYKHASSASTSAPGPKTTTQLLLN